MSILSSGMLSELAPQVCTFFLFLHLFLLIFSFFFPLFLNTY